MKDALRRDQLVMLRRSVLQVPGVVRMDEAVRKGAASAMMLAIR